MSLQDAAIYIAKFYQKNVEARGYRLKFDAQTKRIISDLANYFINRPPHQGLILMGECGNGKTTVLNTVRDIVNDQFRLGNLDFMHIKYSCDREMLIRSAIDLARSAVDYSKLLEIRTWLFLGIDDLGAEPAEIQSFGNIINPLTEILEYRYRRGHFTAVTTNLPPSQITEIYGVRIGDRFKDMFHKIIFDAPSYRGAEHGFFKFEELNDY